MHNDNMTRHMFGAQELIVLRQGHELHRIARLVQVVELLGVEARVPGGQPSQYRDSGALHHGSSRKCYMTQDAA